MRIRSAGDVSSEFDSWDYGPDGPFMDWPFPSLFDDAFTANPGFQMMVGNGYHDTQTTYGAARYMVEQSGWPQGRTAMHFYPDGHMTHSTEASLAAIMRDMRALISRVSSGSN